MLPFTYVLYLTSWLQVFPKLAPIFKLSWNASMGISVWSCTKQVSSRVVLAQAHAKGEDSAAVSTTLRCPNAERLAAVGSIWQHQKYSCRVWQWFAFSCENFQKSVKIEKCDLLFVNCSGWNQTVENIFHHPKLRPADFVFWLRKSSHTRNPTCELKNRRKTEDRIHWVLPKGRYGV